MVKFKSLFEKILEERFKLEDGTCSSPSTKTEYHSKFFDCVEINSIRDLPDTEGWLGYIRQYKDGSFDVGAHDKEKTTPKSRERNKPKDFIWCFYFRPNDTLHQLIGKWDEVALALEALAQRSTKIMALPIIHKRTIDPETIIDHLDAGLKNALKQVGPICGDWAGVIETALRDKIKSTIDNPTSVCLSQGEKERWARVNDFLYRNTEISTLNKFAEVAGFTRSTPQTAWSSGVHRLLKKFGPAPSGLGFVSMKGSGSNLLVTLVDSKLTQNTGVVPILERPIYTKRTRSNQQGQSESNLRAHRKMDADIAFQNYLKNTVPALDSRPNKGNMPIFNNLEGYRSHCAAAAGKCWDASKVRL